MSEDIELKQLMRRYYLAQRQAVSPMERIVLNGAIDGRILSAREFAAAPGVVGYASDGSEPELRGVLSAALAQGKTVALPRFVAEKGVYELAQAADLERDLVPGKFGIFEPRADLPAVRTTPDWLWLIPGLAFDAHGTRLGRGKGFYDRLLAAHPGVRMGVFYQCQFSDRALPVEAHDCRLKLAVTENKTYHF